MNYLVLGGGNFSFSLSLAKEKLLTPNGACSGDKLLATSFESLERVLTRPLAQENLVNLRLLLHEHVEILHEVDATRLENIRKVRQSFDLVFFNFPHTGGKNKIHANRKLLREFFISVSPLLSSSDGEVHVSLCRGQGGTPMEESDRRGYNNSWKVVEMAAEGGLVLDRVEPFLQDSYHGYVPTGYRGNTDKGFNLRGALLHVFRHPIPYKESLYPPTYTHDVSFWCNDVKSDKRAFRDLLLDEVLGKYVISVECIDVYHHHGDKDTCGRESYCYRLTYSSNWEALSRTRALDLQNSLRKALMDILRVDLR